MVQYIIIDKTKLSINISATSPGGSNLLNNFKGRLIWASNQERFVDLPNFQLEECGPRGCQPYILYQDLESNYDKDGFQRKLFRTYNTGDYSIDPGESSKDYTLILTDDGFYLHKTIKGKESTDYISYSTLGNRLPQRKKVSYPAELRTPSGQDRILLAIPV